VNSGGHGDRTNLERCPGDGNQGIDGHTLRVLRQRGQLQQQSQIMCSRCKTCSVLTTSQPVRVLQPPCVAVIISRRGISCHDFVTKNSVTMAHLVDEADPVLLALAQADDAARAHADARLTHRLQRRQPVLQDNASHAGNSISCRPAHALYAEGVCKMSPSLQWCTLE
jgi:hypothetical protein